MPSLRHNKLNQRLMEAPPESNSRQVLVDVGSGGARGYSDFSSRAILPLVRSTPGQGLLAVNVSAPQILGAGLAFGDAP